jgi:hypothetical protein
MAFPASCVWLPEGDFLPWVQYIIPKGWWPWWWAHHITHVLTMTRVVGVLSDLSVSLKMLINLPWLSHQRALRLKDLAPCGAHAAVGHDDVHRLVGKYHPKWIHPIGRRPKTQKPCTSWTTMGNYPFLDDLWWFTFPKTWIATGSPFLGEVNLAPSPRAPRALWSRPTCKTRLVSCVAVGSMVGK